MSEWHTFPKAHHISVPKRAPPVITPKFVHSHRVHYVFSLSLLPLPLFVCISRDNRVSDAFDFRTMQDPVIKQAQQTVTSTTPWTNKRIMAVENLFHEVIS